MSTSAKAAKNDGPKPPTPDEVEKLVPELKSYLATAREATEAADAIKKTLRLLPDGEYLDGELVIDTPNEVDTELFRKTVDEPTRLMVGVSIVPTVLLSEELRTAAGVKHEYRAPAIRKALSEEKLAVYLRPGTKRVNLPEPKTED